MRDPNFFIIGAPKCGTTSLAHWLSEHSQVFMSKPKEPHFHNKDHNGRLVPRVEDYEKIFSNATEQHQAVGEASVHYLSSQVAVSNILEKTPNAKFIVCVRDPTDMIVSYHNQLFNALAEDIPDFTEAWCAQEDRRKGKRVPKGCPEPSRLQYAVSGCLGSQLDRLFLIAPRDQVLIIFLDELKADAKAVYIKTLEFLDVTYDGRTDFAALNGVARLRSRKIRAAMRKFGLLKEALGLPRTNLGIMKSLTNLNMNSGKRNGQVDREFVESVVRPHFLEEALKLDEYRKSQAEL